MDILGGGDLFVSLFHRGKDINFCSVSTHHNRQKVENQHDFQTEVPDTQASGLCYSD